MACLGAGTLNDIPYSSFVKAGAAIHLVDWLPGVMDFGIAHRIIEEPRAAGPQCLYCLVNNIDPRDYCCSFNRLEESGAPICSACEISPDEPKYCVAFKKGRFPYVYHEDATGGYASAFGTGLARALDGVTSWRQAFKRANLLAARVRQHRSRLSIPDDSVDLVISSMLISQFEHEPYTYFSRQAAALLGAPTAQEETRLRPTMERLRSTLLESQIERHLEEIERILAPDGRCFLAFELFHCESGENVWYLIEEMSGVLNALARRFNFDIDGCPGVIGDSEFRTNGNRSVVCHLLLAPKPQ